MNDTADATDGVASNGDGEPPPAASLQQSSHESQNLSSDDIFPTYHHPVAYGYGYLYADQAEATQMYANSNNAWVGCCPPCVDYNYYSHHHNFGGGAYNPLQIPQQVAAYADHYGTPYLQPQPQAIPVFPAMVPAMESPGLHSCTNGGSMNSVACNFGELNLQQQPARSHSSSPHVSLRHGEDVQLLVHVRELEEDPRLKSFIDREVLKPHYCDCDGMYNQMSASPTVTPDQSQSQPRPGTGQRYPARPKKDLFVFHIPDDMTRRELYDLFDKFGKLSRACIYHHAIDDGTSEPKGYAFVTFKNLSDALVAVHRLNGHPVRKNKALAVSFCRDKPARPNPANKSTSTKKGMNRAQRRASAK
ncbi:hypothetical protein ACHAWT_005257 [Skeletonema menzelii]